jgi:hypothetical protein
MPYAPRGSNRRRREEEEEEELARNMIRTYQIEEVHSGKRFSL